LGLFQFCAHVARAGDSSREKERQCFPVHQGGVDMGVDQPWEDGLPSQINDLSVEGRGNLTALNLADTFTSDENRHSGLGLISETVDQSGILQ
jgi:hypothetical protein